jgi:glycosyltransferase involved in cell wall biosynthesis/SAM-dependent methyltransferase
MKLAYFSPLNPQPSGISDYSEELLPYLSAHAEIDLFVDGFKPTNQDLLALKCFDYRNDPTALDRLSEYDAAIYHVGNDHRYHSGIVAVMQRHPGVTVFHDFALQDFFLGLAREQGQMSVYLDELEACNGKHERARAEDYLRRGAQPPQFESPLEFPLNCRLARRAEGLIVHSHWNRERLSTLAPSVPVARINHHVTAGAAATPVTGSQSGKNGRVEIASFGGVTPDKGIARALRALSALRDTCEFHYTLVGSAANFPELPELVRSYGLEDRVSITDHVTLAEFQERIAQTDIAINLRERSVGATSGSLCRIMAAGVPAIISSVGAFSEFPDDAVVKIEHDQFGDDLLQAYLRRLIEDQPLRERIGRNARRYVLSEHSIESSAAQYVEFIREVIAGRPRKHFVDGVAAEVSLLGAGANDESFLREVASEIALLVPETKSAKGNSVFSGSPARSAQAKTAFAGNGTKPGESAPGRMPKVEGIDYKRGALEYTKLLTGELSYYLRTKPFCNLHKPIRYSGDGMDPETHRHFNDFANMALALALRADARILDVGCGPGWLSEYFARLGYDVTGIDISEELIQVARERLEQLPYQVDQETPLQCRYLTHDIEISALAEKFDAVICYDSLHHFEDEQKVFRHLAAMLNTGGLLFILEGRKPAAGSATEDHLRGFMRDYKTLESPFSDEYLYTLLDQHGFAIVGNYVSVNGLFEREMIEDDANGQRLPLGTIDTDYHYLTCMKVSATGPATSVADSTSPDRLLAELKIHPTPPRSVAAGAKFEVSLTIKNSGNTVWLTGQTVRAGLVMPGVKIFDDVGNIATEFHGPLLPRAVAPGQTIPLKIQFTAPDKPGAYSVKIDLVDQCICWFEEKGSTPVSFSFKVETT